MAKKINFETHVVEFYGKSSKNAFLPGNKSEELLATVKFKNESDYNFFKKCFTGFTQGVFCGQAIVKKEEVASYKVFECAKFVNIVVNERVTA